MSLPPQFFDTLVFISLILPPVLGYFLLAVLTVTPKTHILRMALWPILVLFAVRAAVFVDLAPGVSGGQFRNMLFSVSVSFYIKMCRQQTHNRPHPQFSMFSIVTRTMDWALAKEPLVRHLRPAKASASPIMDGLDLALTLRGYGWNWSRGVHFPRETRPTDRTTFILYVVLSAVFHSIVCGVLHIAIRSFSPRGFGSLSGASIFDDTISFYGRYLRASIVSLFAMYAIMAVFQICYDTCTLLGVLVLGQDPAQWPPAFDAPWFATSMRDFWGRRWHQFFRHMFLVQGGYPLSFLLGKVGYVIGTFLSSGIHHYIVMTSLIGRADPWETVVGFGMMGSVILVEWAFKQLTGRRVGGVVGWVWTMTWLLVFGNMIVDAFAKAGVFGHFSFTEDVVPGRQVVRGLVTNLDAWLRTL